MGVVQEESGVVERLPVREAREGKLDEVPGAEDGRGPAVPGLLDPEEESRFSRDPARSERPDEDACDGSRGGNPICA